MKWYDIKDRAHKLRTFNIIIGGRGIGKTYSALSYLMESGSKFIYMRNTDVQIKESATEFGNPFKRWALDHGRDIRICNEGKHAAIREYSGDEYKTIGYAASLSTSGNLRGVDLSDVDLILFDEFIELQPLRFNQYEYFIKFYETVNRNRELLGSQPVRVFLLSNAQKLDNGILNGLGLVPVIESMIRSGQREYSAPEIFLQLPQSSVSEAKRNTALYIAANKSNAAREALDNEFANDDFYGIGVRPLNEYMPVCAFDDVYIYRHKSDGSYYCCRTPANNIPKYQSRNPSLFYRNWIPKLGAAYAVNKLYYSDFGTKSRIVEIF